ncbi:MAG: ABC transporter permease subunit [Rhodospirillales bacterium]|nr:ABC transporter permease subunit [Rhodospirillales bacterium]
MTLALIALLGTPLAQRLAAPRPPGWRGKAIGIVEAMVLLPMLTPTLAMGIVLAATFGPNTALGAAAQHLGLRLTNSFPAFLLAGVYAALPVYVVGARAALAEVPSALTDVARTLGDRPGRLFFRITLPLAGRGIAAALALAWVRAVGEFGVVLIIAYYPQGLPVRLWVDFQEAGLPAVFPLVLAFLALALPLPLALGLRARR